MINAARSLIALSSCGALAVGGCAVVDLPTASTAGDAVAIDLPADADPATGPDDESSPASPRARSANLRIRAVNDVPGPVTLEIRGWDVHGEEIVSTSLTWSADDNTFSVEGTDISKRTRVLRLTFVDDVFTGPDDLDRNAFIDGFWVNRLWYEGEAFDRTGGPDPQFPGCDAPVIDGVEVAGCGNEGDWVEYDLHPGNPVGKS